LLIWPLVRAYRRKTRKRLSWQLAGSHFATVLVSMVVICMVTIAVATLAAKLTLPGHVEVAFEAGDVAGIIQQANASRPLTNDEADTVLTLIASGAVTRNNQADVSIHATAGAAFKYVRSVSIVAPNGTVQASSDPALRGTSLPEADTAGWTIVQRALATAGRIDEAKLSMRRGHGPAIAGAYPLVDGSGQVIGAVLMDKSRSAVPSGWGLLHLLAIFTAQFGTFLLLLVGLPAIPVGIVLGIRRGRAIGRPISNLADTAGRFAAGDFSSRVGKISGQDEVAELQHEFNGMADLLQSTMANEAEQRTLAEQALAANQELIANVSHELRTPVALIRGHLEALQDDPESSEAYLRIVLRETDRLERLVDELFQLSRLEAHRIELDLAPFDPGAAVRAAVESLVEPARREAGLTLMTSVEPGDLTCIGDRLRVEQVLLNLLRNAIHFTPEGGIVMATVGSGPAGWIRIGVQDTGVGISEEDIPRVFDRFYRADRSRGRAAGGAGLGLAIARELVLAMGGTISVESVQDEGTVFTIELPRAARPGSPATNGRSVPAAASVG
jgi:signal transduction histidine kinase